MLLSNLPKGAKLTKTAINESFNFFKKKYGKPGGMAEKNPSQLITNLKKQIEDSYEMVGSKRIIKDKDPYLNPEILGFYKFLREHPITSVGLTKGSTTVDGVLVRTPDFKINSMFRRAISRLGDSVEGARGYGTQQEASNLGLFLGLGRPNAAKTKTKTKSKIGQRAGAANVQVTDENYQAAVKYIDDMHEGKVTMNSLPDIALAHNVDATTLRRIFNEPDTLKAFSKLKVTETINPQKNYLRTIERATNKKLLPAELLNAAGDKIKMADPIAGFVKRKERMLEGLKYVDDAGRTQLGKIDDTKFYINQYFKTYPEEILKYPKIKQMLNAKIDKDFNLTFNKGNYLTDKQLIDKAKKGDLLDIFDISPIAGEEFKIIMQPSNKLISVGNFNQGQVPGLSKFFNENLGSNNPITIEKKNVIVNFLDDFGLSVDIGPYGNIGSKKTDYITSLKKLGLENVLKRYENVPGTGSKHYTKIEFQPDTYSKLPLSKRNLNKGGRVEMDEGGTAFDALIKQNQEEHGMELKDAIDEAIKEFFGMESFADGGRVGYAEGNRVIPSAAQRTIGGGSTRTIGGPTNKVGTIESMLAGIGAGLIDIPRGAFVLGTALMDMGLGTNNAAKVEKWFDELTNLDEKAEATTIGGMVRLLTNLGIPGATAFNMGTKATKAALLAKRNGNYFRITDPKLEERMKTALNGKGRLYATLGGAGAAGVSDAIFIGDVNKAGTLGDMFGGPTQLNENDANEASKEVMNRIKFGLDSSLMMGVIGGTGSAIKTAVKRRNDMASDNDALDKFLSKLRPRGDKPQEFFEMERANIGARAGDVNYAGEVARSLDKHIDGIFPFVVNPFNKMGNNGRKEFMKELNDVLLSGKPEIGVTGRFDFGELDPDMVKSLTAKMKGMGAKQSDIDGVFKEFYNIRGGWGHMFSRLGAKMDKANLDEFRTLFSNKFSNYLGSTYEIFQNKSIIPMLNYRPSEEAVNKAIVMFKQSAKEAGEEITDAQARHYVDKMVEGARLPSSPTSGLYLDVPDFFANRTILDDLGGKNKIGYENFTEDAKKVVNELLGKIEDPMQTVLAGTGRLSLIARRNEFYNDLIKRSKEEIAAGRKGFFYDDESAAINALGSNIKKVEIDPSRTIEAGITNPMNGMYAEKAVAEAIEQSAMIQRDKEWYTQMYDSFILYPKATSQIAKTILSPITHVRNFVSAGAFAGANGLLPGVTISPDKMAAAMKDSYRALQTNLPGSRIANDEYRELLRLGVVNSNVRLGDLQRLLKDVQFGETLSAQTGLRGLTKQLSKVKKWTEDMYTAEDDFWKITSYALERQRLNDAYAKVGIKVDPKALNEEAASIVRNNIPNYDMVNEFVKGLRRLPFGNFVSFPAEIMRTTTNILGRALKEINYQHTLDDGRVVNPLRGIGMKRLFGLGATTVAVPYGVVEGAKTLYDVSGAEMDALRRFVPEWSRNSTLVPIKDRETGELKYIDFSHTNAYDTMIRPINTMINSIGKGVDEGEIMKNVAIGMFDATKETFSPFMSESIWFEAASDIILRGGRTREGRRLYTDETPWGEKVSIVAGHIAKTQVPGSVEAFKRLDLAVESVDIIQKGKYDKYGRTYELGDELLGFAGARAVAVDPLRSMKFKIADYRTGVNNARREFTTPLLRGGPVDPADIVDRYAVANQALYNVNKELFDDYYAARVLGTKESAIDGQFADRVSTAQLNAIKTGRFKPFIPSENIIKAFADNAREIGERNPYRIAEKQINRMAQKYNNLPLYDTIFPVFENPFNLPSAPLPPAATNVTPVGGLSPGSVVQTGMNNPLINNRTMQQGQRVFGLTDTIFGS